MDIVSSPLLYHEIVLYSFADAASRDFVEMPIINRRFLEILAWVWIVLALGLYMSQFKHLLVSVFHLIWSYTQSVDFLINTISTPLSFYI